MKKSFFVYILKCADQSYYTGYTDNLDKRVKKHNLGKAAKYTSGRRPVKLVYSEGHEHKNSAMSRELQLKRWTRAEKEVLITGDINNHKNRKIR
jgi:putative endonuclease